MFELKDLQLANINKLFKESGNLLLTQYQEKLAVILLSFLGLLLLYFMLHLLIRRSIVLSIRLKEKLTRNAIPAERINTLHSIFNSFLKLLFILALLLVVLNVLEIKLIPILAGAGFIGAALIVSFQDLIRDIFKGWLMIFEDQYRKGEWILVNNTFQGEVIELSLRRTTLRDRAGNLSIIPNNQINFISNLSRNLKRFSVNFWVKREKLFIDFKPELEGLLKQFSGEQNSEVKPVGLKIKGPEKLLESEYLIEISLRAPYTKGEAILENLRNFLLAKNQEAELGIKREE